PWAAGEAGHRLAAGSKSLFFSSTPAAQGGRGRSSGANAASQSTASPAAQGGRGRRKNRRGRLSLSFWPLNCFTCVVDGAVGLVGLPRRGHQVDQQLFVRNQ